MLRNNPLVAGLLYVREAGNLSSPIPDDFVGEQLTAELVRLQGAGVQRLGRQRADGLRDPGLDEWVASHLPDLGVAAVADDEAEEGDDSREARYSPEAEA